MIDGAMSGAVQGAKTAILSANPFGSTRDGEEDEGVDPMLAPCVYEPGKEPIWYHPAVLDLFLDGYVKVMTLSLSLKIASFSRVHFVFKSLSVETRSPLHDFGFTCFFQISTHRRRSQRCLPFPHLIDMVAIAFLTQHWWSI